MHLGRISLVSFANAALLSFPVLCLATVGNVQCDATFYLVIVASSLAAACELHVSRHSANRWTARPNDVEAKQQWLSVCTAGALLVTQWTMLLENAFSGTRANALLIAGGLVLWSMGIVCRWRAIGTLRCQFTNVVRTRPEQRLTTAGIFRHVRHPSELGMLLLLAGLTCIAHSWIGFGLLLVCIVPLTFARIVHEERELTRAFGVEYQAYQRRTPCLIPRWL